LSLRLFPSTWEASGFGGTNLLLWRYPINFVHGLFGRSGFNYNISDRFITMLPWVILSMISMYFLLKHFFKSSISIFTGTIIFTLNTYFLSISSQGHLLISVSSSFAILSLFFYIKIFFSEKKRIYLLLTV